MPIIQTPNPKRGPLCTHSPCLPSGITATLICFPLDVLRTRLMAPWGHKYGGPLTTLKCMVKYEGPGALYAGGWVWVLAGVSCCWWLSLCVVIIWLVMPCVLMTWWFCWNEAVPSGPLELVMLSMYLVISNLVQPRLAAIELETCTAPTLGCQGAYFTAGCCNALKSNRQCIREAGMQQTSEATSPAQCPPHSAWGLMAVTKGHGRCCMVVTAVPFMCAVILTLRFLATACSWCRSGASSDWHGTQWSGLLWRL